MLIFNGVVRKRVKSTRNMCDLFCSVEFYMYIVSFVTPYFQHVFFFAFNADVFVTVLPLNRHTFFSSRLII